MNADRAYLFAGGGTGGHIFPGLAIAEELRRLAPGSAGPGVHFACSHRPIDETILTEAGEAFTRSSANPVGASPRVALRFVRGWGRSLREARGLIRSLRETSGRLDVIAMGGFVAAPFARAAKVERTPLTLVNLDAVPGRANRWVARLAGRAFTAADAGPADWVRVPPIVRRAARAPGESAHCRAALGLDPAKRTLLICGGSQGARTINGLAERLAANGPAWRAWQVIHQTGTDDAARAAAAWSAAGVSAVVRPFFDLMGLCWGASDLALARAGAGSVAEAWANHVPTVFLPYPHHKDGHQRANARPLETAGGAVIETDLVDPARNMAGAGKTALDLMENEARLDEMRRALCALGPADGAERIARALVGG
ncbi:MAG: UDP-N-acetylglucosamine--N-acetylmuramyl-(pentapeptide) pyrophosphoryl-undecaprenol N-acetylglucosamine transferase [Phycisphaerales bacterium]|nr:UDP-N-acetylglucosamine--N-acetylmuramyl-(pentapeptide) pyrophosphoryl-undecaprenol N-acetylglucosamine transferase [Phycisphaerales bacterium]